MRTILWANRALADFNRRIEYIAAASPKGARLVADRLHKAIDNLAKTPSGRFGRFAGTYEKLVPKTSCVVVYTKDDNAETTRSCASFTHRENGSTARCRIRLLAEIAARRP